MTNSKNKDSKDKLHLFGAVSMGTGVMIGAGILALTGQMAELAGTWFPLAFIAGAVVAGFSAYSYVKLASEYPSAGGIAMFLKKAYGRSVMTGAMALLMYFSMIINESLVARTFGAYVLQVFDARDISWLPPALGVGLLIFSLIINVFSNRFIERMSFFTALIKILGLLVLAGGGLWAAGFSLESITPAPQETGVASFLGAVALGILGYKGFTTITNSGGKIEDPHRNVGRAIIISISICTVLYLLVALAVGSTLSLEEIIRAKDYSLAEAARPAFGELGVWLTVLFAVFATVSGIIASMFAVSRMLAMLTDMQLVPHRHFKLPGEIQTHTLIYTATLAIILTALFDLSRIASLGAIFYIIMDIGVHWGVLKHLKEDVEANPWILWSAIVLDAVVLVAFIWVKVQSDMLVIWTSIAGLIVIFVGEKFFLKFHEYEEDDPHYNR